MRDGRIVDITPSARTLTSLYPTAEVVDARDRIVIPGFVNAHHHGVSALLGECTAGTPYAAWSSLPRLQGALARLLAPGAAREAALLYRTAGILHLTGGTTTVADFPLPWDPPVLDTALGELASCGVRAIAALQTWEQISAFRGSRPGEREYTISLGAEDGYTVYSLENFVRASAETQFPLAAHIGEQRADAEALRARFRKHPLRVLKDAGALPPSTHLIHCNHLGEKDLDLLREPGIPLTLCIRSALGKQTGYPLLRHLSSVSVPLSLGTDWGPCDMLGEMRSLATLPRYLPGTPAFRPEEILRMATINGARALGIDARCGSLEVGKIADLVMLPSEDLRFPAPGPEPSAAEVARIVVEYCESSMIADVISGGVFRIRGGAPVRTERNELLREFRGLQRAFFPHGAAPPPAPHIQAVPLVPAEKVAGPPPLPEPGPEPSPQKFPVVTKKLKKVFGEDDL